MRNLQIAFTLKEHTEQYLSGIDCQGFLFTRSYQTKQIDRMIS